MSLPASPPISLLGVRNELGLSGTFNLAGSASRGLLGVPSGTIHLLQGLGKSGTIFPNAYAVTTETGTYTVSGVTNPYTTSGSKTPSTYATITSGGGSTYLSSTAVITYSFASGTTFTGHLYVYASLNVSYGGDVFLNGSAQIQWSSDGGSTWAVVGTYNLTSLGSVALATQSVAVTAAAPGSILVRITTTGSYHRTGLSPNYVVNDGEGSAQVYAIYLST